MAENQVNFGLNEDLFELDDSFLLIGEEEGFLPVNDDSFGSFLNDIPTKSQEKNTNASVIVHKEKSAYPPHPSAISNYGTMNAVHMEVQENAKISTFLQPVDRSNSGSINVHSRFQVKKSRSKSSKSRSTKQLKSKDSSKEIFRAKTGEDESALPDFLKGIDFEEDGGSTSSGSFNLAEMFLGVNDR